MQTFPKLQRNISYKIYLNDLIIAFILALLNSSFIYFPLLLGFFHLRLSFILPFLFFVETTHSFPFFSLILFFIIYNKYIYPVIQVVIKKDYQELISIFLIYFLYFSFIIAFFTINDKFFQFNFLFILYYIFIDQLLSIFYKVLK